MFLRSPSTIFDAERIKDILHFNSFYSFYIPILIFIHRWIIANYKNYVIYAYFLNARMRVSRDVFCYKQTAIWRDRYNVAIDSTVVANFATVVAIQAEKHK